MYMFVADPYITIINVWLILSEHFPLSKATISHQNKLSASARPSTRDRQEHHMTTDDYI